TGLTYDWVSRAAVSDASVERGALSIGHARYQALLVEDLPSATPELLARIEAIADAGIPVLFGGDLPSRARGLRDAAARDAEVVEIAKRLRGKVVAWRNVAELGDLLHGAGVDPLVAVRDGEFPYAMAVRRLADGVIVLLFNERGLAGPVQISVGAPASQVL